MRAYMLVMIIIIIIMMMELHAHECMLAKICVYALTCFLLVLHWFALALSCLVHTRINQITIQFIANTHTYSDMTNVNIEMAQLNRVNLHNAVVKEMYVSGATLFEGIKDIENSDWSETYLRADQRKYLCAHPTAKGVNPKTGVETRESLLCVD